MKSFSFSRFRSVVRYLFFTNRRMLLTTAVVPFAIVLLFVVYEISNSCSLTFDVYDFRTSAGFFMLFFALFSASCGARMIYSSRKRAGEYTSLLVLPASNLEKFVALFVVCVLFPQILFSVSFWLPIFLFHFTEVTQFVHGINSAVVEGLSFGEYMLTYAIPVCSLAAFIFSGALFSRLRFVMGAVLHLFFVGALGYVSVLVAKMYDFNEYVLNTEALAWWALAGYTALTVALVCVSYRLFCRSQAVQGRFLAV